MEKLFDLNIEKVLDNWETKHAIREIIANALDEMILTNSNDIDIYKEENKWHIRDYGRGIQYKHFTQNENEEKLNSINLIGKFGVGLKDALAVFYRKGIKISIQSKYAIISLVMSEKSGFDIDTLHAKFENPLDTNFIGTDFVIEGCNDEDIEMAKSMFLYFNKEELIEKNMYGEVYKKNSYTASIYINGVQVATEENFMYSYNITNLNAKIKKALNRERTNVGRTAYSDSVKNILKNCTSDEVLLSLVNDLENVMRGTNKDETSWTDIAIYATKTLEKNDNTIFITPEIRSNLTNQQVEILEQSDKNVVFITDNIYNKIDGEITTFENIYKEYTESFKYDYVDVNRLSAEEKKVLENGCEKVVSFMNNIGYQYDVPIRISNTITLNRDGIVTEGVYDHNENAIIILRKCLSDNAKFMGVLMHEFVHYNSGFEDNTRLFESELTDIIGKLFLNYEE